MNQVLSLGKGNYMGDVVETCHADGIIAGTTVYTGDTDTSRLHYHSNTHISFVLTGGGIEKKSGGTCERLTGDLTFYSAGELHQNIQKIFPSRNINLEIDGSFLTVHELTEAVINTAVNNNPDAKFMMLKIYKELIRKDETTSIAIQMLLLNLIHDGHVCAKQPPWIRVIRDLLHECWNVKVTLSDLSAAAGVCPVTISKNFHRYFGCTFGEYFRKIKIEKSLSLIRKQDAFLTGIAFDCNFSDQSHFTRSFKKLTGLLPKDYRQL